MGIQKVLIQNLVTHRAFEAPINPEEYSVTSGNKFEPEGMQADFPALQFAGRDVRSLTMKLFFDSSHSRHDVRGLMRPLLDLLDRDRTTGAPPLLLVIWGSLRFRCVLTNASQDYTQFLANGSPVRATVALTFWETRQRSLAPSVAKTAELGQTTEVQQGESLTQVAQRTSGDPARWREIADQNNIDNPRKPSANLTLFLPKGLSKSRTGPT